MVLFLILSRFASIDFPRPK